MDIQIRETGNGGDAIKNLKDLSVIFGFENVPYLAMFGGNLKQSTPTKRDVSQLAYDWWGNDLLMPNDTLIQFNSETERALDQIPLTSSGRVLIENAVKADLSVMESYCKVTVDTQITSDDRIEIGVTLKRPDNLTSTSFVYIWDSTIKELTFKTPIPFNQALGTFDYSFDKTFF